MNNSNLALYVAMAIAVIGWVLAGMKLALGDRSRIGDRVRTLEVQRAEDSSRMGRIESKLDRLLERLE